MSAARKFRQDFVESTRDPEEANAKALAEHLSIVVAENNRLMRQIAEQTKKLANLNRVDPNLRLANQHAYEQRIRLEVEMSARGRRLGLIVLNVIDFPQILANHGLSFGQQLLRQLADRIQLSVSSIDLLANLGGSEFSIILPDRLDLEIHTLCNKLRRELEEIEFVLDPDSNVERYRIAAGYSCLCGPYEGVFDGVDVSKRLYRLADRVRHRGLHLHSSSELKDQSARLCWMDGGELSILEPSIQYSDLDHDSANGSSYRQFNLIQ